MATSKFIAVGENIHCTRILKVGGEHVKSLDGKTHVIVYREGGEEKHLPVPEKFVASSDWKGGKVKHAAVAMWQGLNGDASGRAAGIDYLKYMARRQEVHGAWFLDLNVDEYSTDIKERLALVGWAAGIVQAGRLDSPEHRLVEPGDPGGRPGGLRYGQGQANGQFRFAGAQ